MKDTLFAVKETDQRRQVLKFLREYEARAAAAMSQLTREAAEMLVSEVAKRIPDVRGFSEYRRSLYVARVDGVVSGFAVAVDAEAAGDVGSESRAVVLKFSSVAGRQLTASDQVLLDEGAWPEEMLPVEPSTAIRATVYRVSSREAEDLRRRRRESWEDVKARLKATGAKVPDEPVSFAATEVDRSLAFEVLRQEFGIGTQMRPHWRPAIRAVEKKFPMLMRNIRRTLTDVRYNGWRQAQNVTTSLSASQVAGMGDFMSKVR